MLAGPKIEGPQLSLKFSLNITWYATKNFRYTLSATRSEKKAKTKIQVKYIKIKFLRTYSQDLNQGIFTMVCKQNN